MTDSSTEPRSGETPPDATDALLAEMKWHADELRASADPAPVIGDADRDTAHVIDRAAAVEAFYTTPRCDVHAIALSRWPNQVTMDPQCRRCCKNGLRAAAPHLLAAVVGAMGPNRLIDLMVQLNDACTVKASDADARTGTVGAILERRQRDHLLAALTAALTRLDP